MGSKETEPKLLLPQIEQELNTTLDWARDWSSRVRNWWDLTPRKLHELCEGHIREPIPDFVSKTVAYYLSARHSQDRSLGPVDILEFKRVHGNPNQPSITGLFYEEGNFETLVGVSFVRHALESEVLYERINFPKGRIRGLIKITCPSILFPSPQDSLETQKLELGFYYHEDGKFVGWLGEVGFEEKELGRVLFANGVPQKIQNNVPYPHETLNPIPYLEAFGRGRSPVLLIL